MYPWTKRFQSAARSPRNRNALCLLHLFSMWCRSKSKILIPSSHELVRIHAECTRVLSCNRWRFWPIVLANGCTMDWKILFRDNRVVKQGLRKISSVLSPIIIPPYTFIEHLLNLRLPMITLSTLCKTVTNLGTVIVCCLLSVYPKSLYWTTIPLNRHIRLW